MDLLVIPDGNRRWAKERGRDFDFGYAQFPIGISKVIETLTQEGITHLYFWCNSIANLQRPPEEIKSALGHYLRILEHSSDPSRLRVHVRGNTGLLPEDFTYRFFELQAKTREHQGFDLYYFVNYETVDDMRRAVQKIDNPEKVGDIEAILANMDEPDNIDVILRTGGHHRLSGFTPIKSPNAELIAVPQYFPDISPEMVREAIRIGQTRVINDGR